MFGIAPSGQTCYALLFKAHQYANGFSLETFTTGNYSTYPITVTEDGGTGNYFADFPAYLTVAGTYEYVIKIQTGGSPAQSDQTASSGKVDWTGTTAISTDLIQDSMSGSEWRDYVLRGGFRRTDKDTELFEETTDAIQEMRRRFIFDESEVEMTTTDTISVLGDFKIDVESNFGLLLGVILEDGTNATPLIQLSKSEFNNRYPYNNVDTTFTGYPRHFTIYKGQIQIGPIPDRISYGYRLSYSKRAGTILSSTVSVPFTVTYRDVLRANVLSRLWMIMDDYDKAATFKQSFEVGFENAKTRERLNSGVGNFCVTPFGM